MLFLDLVVLDPESLAPRRPLVLPGSGPEWWALTEWRLDYATRTFVPWPTPPWPSLWEYDLFLGLWNAAVARSAEIGGDGDARLRYLLYCWLEASTAVLEQEPSAPPAQPPDSNRWEALIDRLESLLLRATADESDEGMLSWFRDLTALLMPERIGLPYDDIRGAFARSDAFKQFWRREASEIVQLRLDVLRRMTDAGLRPLAVTFAETALPGDAEKFVLSRSATDTMLPRT
jgi:hypothetical protein